MKYFETIIVGAGPCGLAAAIELKQNNIEYLVIEEGNIVNAIYNYPTHQTFFSSSDKLAIGNFPFITEAHKPKRNQALVYYREVVKHYNLNINTFEKVTSSRKTDTGFTVETSKGHYTCKYLIIATGYYGQPNTLDVPGSHKNKVFHYFKEAHPFFNQHVLIIGGKNSSVDAAIELEKAGSHVTIIYRGDDYSKSIKPWILPQLKSLIKHGKVDHYFNADMIDIKDDSVIFSTDDGIVEIKNDFVFAMIGYHPDYRFLKSLGIELEEYKNGLSPVHNSETMETNVDDLYIAGVIAAGNDANMIVIENGRFHGGRIIKDIIKKKSHK
ncbi:YpdA family putative bacillithiol disulfide reductase [Salinicoccus sp. YB14-2]|uniref:YpdA family putative bacillithiol disulfide reductase n=1 Tax=Salinicoccus sp. YB14-2 TaxID=1572701 RepID=UPI00068941BC|nr:YpdA family putative bacillithiol disulfide reductase [Salinicoccus sp. YB14-2]